MYLCAYVRRLEVSPMRTSLVKVALAATSVLVLASCAMPADDPNFNASAGAFDEEASAEASQAAVEAEALDTAFLAPEGIGVDAPLKAAPEKGAVIVSITDGSAYDSVFQTSLAAAAEALGWTVETITADYGDPAAAASAMTEAVGKKPAGIHITGAFATAAADVLPDAETANIPVICTGCSGDPTGGITNTTLDGTEQNRAWADVLATYVVENQYEGEDAGVQMFAIPGGAVADFNNQFSTKLLEKCRNCSASESVFDPMMVDMSDPVAVATFVTGEMSMSLGAWALLDSGAQSEGVADMLATDPTLLSPIVLIGRGAAANDIAALQALGGAGVTPGATDASASAAPTEAAAETASAAATEGATDAAAEMGGRTPEETAELQAWIGISQPILAWRVIDQFARIIGGEEPSVGPIPSQILTGANVGEAVLDESGNYLGVADYQEQFKALWGVK